MFSVLLLLFTCACSAAAQICSTCTTATCSCKEPVANLDQLECDASWTNLELNTPNLTSVTRDVFYNAGCASLTKLSLRGESNELSTLPPDVFQGLGDLSSLLIGYRRLEELQPGVFNGLNRLKDLQLDKLRLRILKAGSLRGLTSLQTLQVTNNYLSDIQDGFFEETPNLKTLHLLHNNISKLTNSTFSGLQQLVTLRANGITHVAANAFVELVNLEELILGTSRTLMNRIWTEVLRDVFKPLVKLRVLKLINTKVTNIQMKGSPLEKQVELQELVLDGNVFKTLDRALFVGLHKLRILSVRENQLSCLYNRNFGSLSNLENLDLRNNDLTYISREAFLGLRKLQVLRLAGNPVVTIEAGTFCSLALPALKNVGQVSTEIDMSVYQGQNLSEPCPKDFDTERFKFDETCLRSNKYRLPPSTEEPGRTKSEYFLLLIIVAVCVVFLLVAIALILSYRAWSKRKNKQLLEGMGETAQEMVPVPSQAPKGPSPTPNGGAGAPAAGGDAATSPESKPLIGAPAGAATKTPTATQEDGTMITTLAVV